MQYADSMCRAADPSCSACLNQSGGRTLMYGLMHAVEQLQLRSAALYLLMAFIGGQAQSLYAVQAFVRRAFKCYR